MLILERMNKIYTKNSDRINESTDWIHYFYDPANGWSGGQNLQNCPTVYWTHVKNLSLKYKNEDDFKKRAFTVYSKEKNFSGVEEKDPFLVDDDENLQGIRYNQMGKILCIGRYLFKQR